MPKLPGIHHLQAIRALEKAGFRVARQGKHVVMTDGIRILTIPRHNPINAITMRDIVGEHLEGKKNCGFTGIPPGEITSWAAST